jgi:hypothetical protein
MKISAIDASADTGSPSESLSPLEAVSDKGCYSVHPPTRGSRRNCCVFVSASSQDPDRLNETAGQVWRHPRDAREHAPPAEGRLLRLPAALRTLYLAHVGPWHRAQSRDDGSVRSPGSKGQSTRMAQTQPSVPDSRRIPLRGGITIGWAGVHASGRRHGATSPVSLEHRRQRRYSSRRHRRRARLVPQPGPSQHRGRAAPGASPSLLTEVM